jgi:ABC-type polysaccharide/polyol phosphate export permease
MDVQHIWAALTPLWYFATPVFYSVDTLPEPAQLAIGWLNPLTPFLAAYRAAFIGGQGGLEGPFWQSLALAAVALGLAYIIFLRIESAAVERA